MRSTRRRLELLEHTKDLRPAVNRHHWSQAFAVAGGGQRFGYLGSSDYSFYVFGLSEDLIRRPFFRQLWVRCAWRTRPPATGSTLS
jgi:hypothetical protein